MKILAFKIAETSGVAYYRHIKPIEYLKRAGHEVIEIEQGIAEEELNKAVFNADVIFVCSPMGIEMLETISTLLAVNESEVNLLKSGSDALRMTKMGLSTKKLHLWVDYDDDIWTVSPLSEHYKNAGRKDVKRIVNGKLKNLWVNGRNGFDIELNKVNIRTRLMFLRLASIVTTPSVNLVRKFKRFNKRNVLLFPNGLDMNVWGGVEKKHEDKKELRILWTLSSSHLGDWLQLEKPLSVVLNRNPLVKLVTVGEKFNSKHIHPKKREHYTWLPSVDKYAEFIKGLNCDIGIGHVTDERFNVYKSPLKACEYGALGLCAVLQGKLYGDYVTDKEAVVYYTKSDFVKGLQKVIDDVDLRKQLSYNLNKKVKENYTLDITCKMLENELLRVVNGGV